MKHLLALAAALLLVAATPAMADGGHERKTVRADTPPTAEAHQRASGSVAARRQALLPLVHAARPARLPFALVDAVITQESGYRTHVRGRHGEVGLMQILPSTARSIARTTGLGSVTGLSNAQLVTYLSKPANNLRVGLAYLEWCHERADGHVGATIGCYNAGPGNMWRWNKIPVTRRYVRNVERHMSRSGYVGS